MTSLDIVKRWNAVKKRNYRFVDGENPSAIVKLICVQIEKYGEELITSYYVEKMDKGTIDDIWKCNDDWMIDEFKKQKEQEEKNKETNGDLSILSCLSKELVKVMGNELSSSLDKQIIEKINKYVEDKIVIKVVEYKGEQKKVDGITHEKFADILAHVSMDEPIMLVGPAGTGKNVICKQVADALGLDFYFTNAINQKYELTGFVDAMGNFQGTQFYEAFTKGGLFLLDEMDASIPEALIVLNAAIANRYFDFPGKGRVQANPNFRIIACANTYGTGADMDYVGRNQLDGASLNRFAICEVDYDKRIEETVCKDKDILDFCRAFRSICRKNGVHSIVSYREESRLYKMITIAKLPVESAIKEDLLKGLERDTLVQIHNDMSDGIVYKSILGNIINK